MDEGKIKEVWSKKKRFKRSTGSESGSLKEVREEREERARH